MNPAHEVELRQQITQVCQWLFQKNLVAATDGNVSARLGPDRILVTPSGVSKGDVRPEHLLVCNMQGDKLDGYGEVTTEVRLHLMAYDARPEIQSVVHAHPPIATALTFAGREALFLEPIVPEVVSQIGPIPTVPFIVPGGWDLAKAARERFVQSDIVLLAQHGAVALGKSPRMAYFRLEKLENLATIIKIGLEVSGGDASRIRRLSADECVRIKAQYAPKVR